MIRKPADIIHHIVGEELGKAGDDPSSIVDTEGKQKAIDAHPGWQMGFTVNKKINSKKLIEEIAKESKLFPLFKGNKLSFNSIKDEYVEGDDDFLIKNEDIISIKFDRTKIEDIKTKVVLDYHYDYAANKYQHTTKSLNTWQTAFDMFEDGNEGYSNMYYGIPEDASDGSGGQGNDVIEVKYIRHHDTSDPYDETITKLHHFLLTWYCNQHNTCEVKLPLRYLYAEVGDITALPNLINERLAYGEDYSLNNFIAGNLTIRNGQEIYPYWMVTGASKSLDSITLDLIQLHNLTPPPYITEGEDIYGCTDPDAINYNPDATIDDGSCEYEPDPEDVYGCTDPRALNYNPDATIDDGSCEYGDDGDDGDDGGGEILDPDHNPGEDGSGIGTIWMPSLEGDCSTLVDYLMWNPNLWTVPYSTWGNFGPYFLPYNSDGYDIQPSNPAHPLSAVAYDPVYNGGAFHIHISCPGDWKLKFIPWHIPGYIFALHSVVATMDDVVYEQGPVPGGEIIIWGTGEKLVEITVPPKTQEEFNEMNTPHLPNWPNGTQIQIGSFYLFGEIDGNWVNLYGQTEEIPFDVWYDIAFLHVSHSSSDFVGFPFSQDRQT